MSHDVYIILDRAFAGDLWSLSRNSHVWLIKSPCNEAAARLVWGRETNGYSPLHGVTTFDGAENTSDGLYEILDTIDEHHNEYSASKPWNTIHVIGFRWRVHGRTGSLRNWDSRRSCSTPKAPRLLSDGLSYKAMHLTALCAAGDHDGVRATTAARVAR